MKAQVSGIYLGNKTKCKGGDGAIFYREEKRMMLIDQRHQSYSKYGEGHLVLGFTVLAHLQCC